MEWLEELVNDSIRRYSDHKLNELIFYAKYKDDPRKLVNLIAWAKTSQGKTHPHQRRVKRSAKSQLEELLLTNYLKFKELTTFDDLYKSIRIKGIGSLTVYDVATRLGCCYGLYPTKEYLHRGT